jgi:sarcosine oxidase subunit alpha
MGWVLGSKKPFYVGARSVELYGQNELKRRLVGFRLTDNNAPCPEECHLVIRDGEITGRVTSAARSPTLGEVIGLAYVAPNQVEPDSDLDIRVSGGRMVQAKVVPYPFYDPDNTRQEL